jgi:hypothetical protein
VTAIVFWLLLTLGVAAANAKLWERHRFWRYALLWYGVVSGPPLHYLQREPASSELSVTMLGTVVLCSGLWLGLFIEIRFGKDYGDPRK